MNPSDFIAVFSEIVIWYSRRDIRQAPVQLNAQGFSQRPIILKSVLPVLFSDPHSVVKQAAKGHEFVIAKAGKPMVRVVPLRVPSEFRALGFLAGQGTVAADLKKTFARDIDAMFGASR